MKRRILITLLILPCIQAFAQEKTNSELKWQGYLDFYYQSSPQAHRVTSTTTNGPEVIEGRYFDRHINQMTLNMAELSLQKTTGRTNFRIDLAAGEMVDQLSGGSSQAATALTPTNPAANEPTRNITQAIISYKLKDDLTLSAGKFYTHMGLEVTKAKDNWQYSRSYTYNYGIPFWHEGLSLNYLVIPEKFSTTLYVLNAWDGRISQEQNKSTTLGANLNYTGFKDLTLNYNFIGGAESNSDGQRQVHELNVTYAISDKYAVAFDGIFGEQQKAPTVGNAKWNALAIYLKAKISNIYTFSPRYEVFDDSDQGFAVSGGLTAVGVKQKITSVTLANNFTLDDGLEARLELRSDKSDSNSYFLNKDHSASDHQESYAVALLYSF